MTNKAVINIGLQPSNGATIYVVLHWEVMQANYVLLFVEHEMSCSYSIVILVLHILFFISLEASVYFCSLLFRVAYLVFGNALILYIYIYMRIYIYIYIDEGSLLPKYRDCTTSNDFESYLMCCGVMLQ